MNEKYLSLITRYVIGVLTACMLVTNANSATSLATEPFTSSDEIRALPNVMFVLDDSGSMDSDYLPDWAGPYKQMISGIDTVITPAHRFFNGAFNGVAYNPGTRYRPPVMYSATGAFDATVYPSMTGVSVETGGNASASLVSPNWKAVKKDGFGIQSTAVSDLEASAIFYTTVPGEYCDTMQLRNCIAASAPSGAYTFPAKLRWCTTPEKAIASTADSNTYCQAANIDSTPANLAAGVTHYTFPRMPGPPTALIKVEASGTVTGITVSGQQILSGSASRVTASELAVEIAKKINACTAATTGACAVAGYSAVSGEVKVRISGADVLTNYVTIFAPAATSATPAVTGGGSTTAYAFGTVPGSNLFSQITRGVTSYPYPGTATAGENRKDCAGATCTYEEEMTNYANWYAYYRTRMQMMKTDASIAFSGVDNKFRVGYLSINNAAGTQFLNPSAFDGTQKNLWYSNFLRARPSGATPLRTGLANAGRIFAGKITNLNGVSVTDPMQYSCQQNFTILSTDGYWNDSADPLTINGDSVGQQDSHLDRPYYDGGKWNTTSSKTLWHEEQWGLKEFLVESMTQQQQTSTEQISKVVKTTTTYPYTLQTTPLQTKVTPLIQTDSYLNKREYQLYRTPTVLTRFTQKYQSVSEPLEVYTNKLKEQTAKLNKTHELRVTQTSTKLQYKEYKITATTTDLVQTSYLITKVTSQLQKNSLVSTNGGDSWNWTGYSDAASCNTRANSLPADDIGGGTLVREVLCRYVAVESLPAQSSCTIKAATVGTYDIENPVMCTYEAGTTDVVTGSFTAQNKQTSTANDAVYATATSYAYKTTANTPLTGQDNCTVVNKSTGSPWKGPSRACGWDSAPTGVAVTVESGSCTNATPPSMAGPDVKIKRVCGYTGESSSTTVDTCTVDRSTSSPYSKLVSVTCSYPGGDGSANAESGVGSCTQQLTKASGTTVGKEYKTYRKCAFASASTTSPSDGKDSCTWSGGQSGDNFTGPKVTCSYLGAVKTSSAGGADACTAGSASTDSSSGTTWNKYTSCAFGSAGAPVTNLSLCENSGGISGSDYTGPRVTCSDMSTRTSAVDPACTPSVPNPPVPLFSSPIITCEYVAGTPVADTTCTASATGPTGTLCTYGDGVTTNNVDTCDVVAMTPVGDVYSGPARDCWYADQTPQSITGSCTVKLQDTGTSLTGPARACAYGTTPDTWSPATAACTVVPKAGYVGPAVECAYNGTVTNTPMGSDCSSYEADPGSTFNILQKKVCVAGAVDRVVVADPVTVDTCDSTSTWDGLPASETSVRTATTCTFLSPSIASTPACTESGGVADAIYTTRVTCPVTNLAKDYVATYECTPAGSISPDVFDGSGKIVACKTTYFQGLEDAYKFVASCAEGLHRDDATKRQTLCSHLINTAPVPVDPTTCTAGVDASFKHTYCETSTTSTSMTGCTPTTPTAPSWTTTTCTPIPDTGTENTLADVAAYYYYTDLRAPGFGNCAGAVVAPATDSATLCTVDKPMNNVFATASDPATWQHMTTFTLGLGASGYMTYSSTYTTDASGDYSTVYGNAPHKSSDGIEANPSGGVCSWQGSGHCNWPYPEGDEQTTIDDLWHAGVNGHGAYFSATDPDTLSKSIVDALEGIDAAGGASAAPTISNPNLTPADNYIFSSTYESIEWTGDIVRRQMDPYTGAVSATVDFAVQSKLDAKSPALRNIYTFDASVPTTKLLAFTSANFATNTNFLKPYLSTSPTGLTQFLCASDETCLSSTNQTTASGTNLIEYLRGVRTHEGAFDDNNKYYRQRQHILGDMVNAQAVYVNKPLYNYGDPGYSAYVTAQSSRQPVVYAGANDGMLHAFAAKGSATTEAAVEAAAAARSASSLNPSSDDLLTAATLATATANTALAADTVIGQEMWAYIPSMVVPNLYRLADKKYKDKHRYFVDATPLVGDICVSDCTNASLAEWRTILVGGLGGGGRGYYALDITTPSDPKALWEFSDANLGYSYGNPQITKLSDGTWVVLVTSGYNNIPEGSWLTGDGIGRLFVINASTGALIREISTSVGNTTEPSGLSRITAQVVNPLSDNTAEAVYGGDLLGNLWRFDVNNSIGATGYDAQLLAILKDASGNSQPITTKPEVASIQEASVKVVYVGTGRFLHPDDVGDTSQQSLYAIKDPRTTGTLPGTAIFDNPGGDRSTTRSALGFIQQVHSEIDCPVGTLSSICLSGEKVRASTNHAVDFVLDSGWFVDLLGPDLDGKSERANTDPALALGLLAFNTNAPSVQACDLGGKSYSYFLNYLSGGPIYAPGNGDPALNNGVVGKLLANEFASAPTLVITKSGKLLEVSGLAGGGINVGEPPLPPPASITRRTSWRELIRN